MRVLGVRCCHAATGRQVKKIKKRRFPSHEYLTARGGTGTELGMSANGRKIRKDNKGGRLNQPHLCPITTGPDFSGRTPFSPPLFTKTQISSAAMLMMAARPWPVHLQWAVVAVQNGVRAALRLSLTLSLSFQSAESIFPLPPLS